MLARFKGTLTTLFPPDEDNAPWLVRLAIVRHDLHFELSQLGVPEDATPNDFYRTTYFLRRLSISLLEAENILSNDLGRLLKVGRNDIPSDFADGLHELRAAITTARPTLEAVRDVIGAHMRPKNDATGQPTIAREVLRTHDGWNVDAAIDLDDGRRTNLHDIAMAAFLFAWPTATDDAALDAKHGELQQSLTSAARSVLHATDALLFAYWSDLGIEHVDTDDSGAK